MKIYIVAFLALLLGVQSMQAQSEKLIKSFPPFTTLEVHNGVLVDLIPADTNKAVITYKNVSPGQIKTSLEAGNLSIKLDGNFVEREDVFIKLYYKELNRIQAFTNAEITCDPLMKQSYITVHANSGGEVYLHLDVKSITGYAKKGGVVHVEGYANEVDFSTTGKGVLSGFDLTSQEANLDASFNGTAKITVEKRLSANARLWGSISYKGKPAMQVKKVSLGGELNHITD